MKIARSAFQLTVQYLEKGKEKVLQDIYFQDNVIGTSSWIQEISFHTSQVKYIGMQRKHIRDDQGSDKGKSTHYS